LIRVHPWLAFLLLATLLTPAAVSAQDKSSSGSPEAKPAGKAAKKEAAKGKDAPAITPEREEAVNAFVAEHHPELGELLKHLKESKQHKQYDRAMRDLYAVSERLGNLKKSDKERYDLELKTWQLKSRIQLLTARLSMDDNEPLKHELRQALAEQYDLRGQVLTLEKNRLHERVQKLEKDLIDYDARREAGIDKQFQQLTSTAKPKPVGKTKAAKGTTKP
jgi:hypothetical protein